MISPGRDLRLPWEGTGTSVRLLRNHSATLVPPVIECSEHSEECTEMPSPGRDLRLPCEGTGTSVRPDKFVGTLNPAKGGGGDLSPPPVIECSEHPRSSSVPSIARNVPRCPVRVEISDYRVKGRAPRYDCSAITRRPRSPSSRRVPEV